MNCNTEMSAVFVDSEDNLSENQVMKLEALEKGENTDYSFLVGPEGEAELVHGSKVDLAVASEYFRGMFRSPLNGPLPVRVKHIQPQIFKQIVRFASLIPLERTNDLQDIQDLANVADEFLMKPLNTACFEELALLVDASNVWSILNAYIDNPQVAAACAKVLSDDTRKCLKDPDFEEISAESLRFFLKLEELEVSDDTLLDCCFMLAQRLNDEAITIKFMRAVLPYLRILTLSEVQLCRLSKVLTVEEKAFICSAKLFKEKIPADEVPEDLNTNLKPRQKQPLMIESESSYPDIQLLPPGHPLLGGPAGQLGWQWRN